MAQAQVYIIPADNAGDFQAAIPFRSGASLFTELGLDARAKKSQSLYAEQSPVYVGERLVDGHRRIFLSLEPFQHAKLVPLGRAANNEKSGSVLCPSAELKLRKIELRAKHEFVKVGVVLVINDQNERRLVTQRAPGMRTFPGAWVFPGGGLQDAETIAQTGEREAYEEVGLKVESTGIIGLWESVFPTTADECILKNAISGHYLVIYTRGEVQSTQRQALRLQPSEVQKAAWLQPEHVSALVRSNRRKVDEEAEVATELPSGQRSSVKLRSMQGIYRAGTAKGMAQGHLYILEVVLKSLS